MSKHRRKLTDMMIAVIYTTEVPKRLRSSLIILTYLGKYSVKIKFSPVIMSKILLPERASSKFAGNIIIQYFVKVMQHTSRKRVFWSKTEGHIMHVIRKQMCWK